MSFSMSSYILEKKTIPKIRLTESPASLAEWLNRDQYFKQFGGLATDPFEIFNETPLPAEKKDSTSVSEVGGLVLKTAPINLIEELFVAPNEFQDL